MRFPFSLLGLSAQIPFSPTDNPDPTSIQMPNRPEFKFKEGPDVFSPKDLIELARPGAGVANTPGDLALVSMSKYSFEDKKNKKSLVVVPLESTVQPLEIPLIDGGEAFWLDSRTIAHAVKNSKSDVLDLYALSVNFAAGDTALATTEAPTFIGSFPTGTATNFVYTLSTGQLVFSDYVWPDGNLKSVKEQDDAWENRGNTALVYDETYERHWDHWITPKRSNLFSVKLTVDPGRKWHLGEEFLNAIKDTKHETPVEPFGGADCFDVSASQIVYTAKDPKLPPAWHTRQNIYLVDIKGEGKPKELTDGKQGATSSPVFNPSGDTVAWLEMDEDGNEADRNKVVVYYLRTDVKITLTPTWDRSPDSVVFSKSGAHLYLTVGDQARVKIFVLPVPLELQSNSALPSHFTTPVELTSSGAASALQPLPNGRLLFTQSSFTSPNNVYVLRGLDALEANFDQQSGSFKGQADQLTRFSEDSLKSKELDAGEDFWFKGANDKDIQGWILKPKGWKAGETKKWAPLLFIHGGPQSAWEDQWSTRWNPNVFAQQGYFVIAINPTGSTTFGQELTDGISEDWGGKPFVDLRKGWQYILDNYPELDADRAVAAGASWGGYAINWIQSHPEFGFGFKALFCHDGVFSAQYNGYSTEELFFFNHEWGGKPWEPKSKALSEKYSPSNYVDKWSTPQLIVHGTKDYRLPDTEGISAFHALQQRGIPSRLVIMQDENHWVLDHGNSLKWHYEVFRWFDQFVGKD